MAGNFKKRRGPQGPNKNEQKVLRAQNEERQARMAGTISSQFPAVKSLRVHLTFLDGRQQVLDTKNLDLKPSDAAIFTIACPGRCGQGSFDFRAKIAEMLGARLAVSDSGAKCQETLYPGAAQVCGWEVRCRMEIEYFPDQSS